MPERGAAASPVDDATTDDDGAFGQRLVDLQPRLRAFVGDLVRGETRARCSADDVVQEALARAWRSRASFDRGRGDPAPWLLRIAFRAFLDARAQPAAEPASGDPPARALGPAEHASARERTAALLGLLGDREREVLLRFHRDGERIDGIARALGIPAGTVKSDLHRARAKLWAAERDEGNDR